MIIIDALENDAYLLFQMEKPNLEKLRKVLTDVQDVIISPTYKKLEPADQNRLLELRDELQERIKLLENKDTPIGKTGQRNSENNNYSAGDGGEPPGSGHDPKAERLMDRAEDLFYGASYLKAISLYERVLAIEPDWERAQQHKELADTYLKEGCPDDALPDEAGRNFGKAQSAARVKKYAKARIFLEKASDAVKAAGIPRWKSGLEFVQNLDLFEEAETAYQEGIIAFKDGDLDTAIDKAETAFAASGDNAYKTDADKWRILKNDISDINLALTTGVPSIKSIVDAKNKLDQHFANFGEIRALVRALSLLQNTLPRIEKPIIEETGGYLRQSNRAASIDDAIHLVEQAQLNIRSLQELGSTYEYLSKLKIEADEKHQELEIHETSLEAAQNDLRNNHPYDAWKKIKGIRGAYPRDPKMAELNRELPPYSTLKSIAIGIGLLVVIAVLVVLIFIGARGLQNYFIAKTPTITLTPTPTQTQTPIPTQTLTPMPSPTPTSIIYITTRNIFARQDCYEEYFAVVKIPAGSSVTPLGVDTRRDTLGRTCLMVEYQSDTNSYTGWVLLEDLQSP